jgi:hypothetical protein
MDYFTLPALLSRSTPNFSRSPEIRRRSLVYAVF